MLEECINYQDNKEAKFLVCLLECVEETLKSGKMADEFKNPENPHHPDEPHDLSGLPKDLEVLQALDQRRDEVGKDSQKVNLFQ